MMHVPDVIVIAGVQGQGMASHSFKPDNKLTIINSKMYLI